MNINHLLKMRSSIYINPIVDNPSVMDAFSNAEEPDWTLTVSNEKCLIQNFEMRSGNRTMTVSGPENKNIFLGFFSNKRTIGERVVVTTPSNVFPTLYIRSESPASIALTGKINHYEYLLEIERS